LKKKGYSPPVDDIFDEARAAEKQGRLYGQIVGKKEGSKVWRRKASFKGKGEMVEVKVN
jgi:hypothetical protein